MKHRWHFFRAGGVDQVSLRDSSDLLELRDFDRKLWLALAMPIAGIDLDPETLALLDLDRDGRIRVEEIYALIDFVEAALERPADILVSRDAVELGAIRNPKLRAAAKHILGELGKRDATSISVDDTVAVTKAFSTTVLNGDRVVIPESSSEPDVKRLIGDAIEHVGSTRDRSGKPGVDREHLDQLFAAVDARCEWLAKARRPLGDATDAAATALLAVRAKIDDYFMRCQVAAYDARGVAILAGKDEDLVALTTRTLSADDEGLAKLPLAPPNPNARLPLSLGINPAWSARMAAFASAVVTPILGTREELTSADLANIVARLEPYIEWQAAKPQTKADELDLAWLSRVAEPSLRAAAFAVIEEDGALAAQYDEISSVAKLVRLQRDGGRLLRNFVNFSDFYSKQDSIFQAGTLYLDARALHLTVPVADPNKHAALAVSSGAYLLYCDLKRGSETRQIAAAVTNGDADNLFVGRNGVFYDRKGDDWDATIVKIAANPISVREAFWSPYKKLARAIEDTVTKRAAAADAAATSKAEAAGKQMAEADKAAPAPGGKKIDLGTVAAIGVAIGGIGTLVGALLGTMFGLGKWLPLGVLALLLMISGPSMLLAWLKLRRRNLGPILDANGWAINGRARINVAFGARMTELAALPTGSQRSLDDPFADKKTPWKRWLLVLVVLVLGICWYLGKLDRYLPERIRSVSVLGDTTHLESR